MKKEDVNLDLSGVVSPGLAPSQEEATVEDGQVAASAEDSEDAEDKGAQTPHSQAPLGPFETASGSDANPAVYTSTMPTLDDESEDDDYVSRDAIEARLTGKSNFGPGYQKDDVERITTKTAEMTVTEDNPPAKKIGMAKAKKQKKAARQAAAKEEGHPRLIEREAGFGIAHKREAQG
ncbi:hypothetical protein ONZ43_g858 [Nemania bipapillata]|uniref:Uncharacterized protein n=1 Tax=Nemania bipapillata TaxID=110536 RepID=A0ACC2J6G8_9PEZI|nr:hypothetical protein ONZ43_g858 [Nemania bipapillata]